MVTTTVQKQTVKSALLEPARVIAAYNQLTLVDPTFVGPPDFAEHYASSELLRKSYTGESHEARARAIETYVTSQAENSVVNQRLDRITPAYVNVLHVAREKIRSMLHGRKPTELRSAPTSGASYAHARNLLGYQRKCGLVESEVTFGCLSLWRKLSRGSLYSRAVVSIVPGNRLALVEKDAETKRAITCEPTLNLLVQRQYGIAIRDALYSVGIDLRDQTLNQRLAEAAWSDGLATLDLRNASNSLSISLCRQLLPWEWFIELMMCRSESTLMPDGSTIELEFMGSMGNGFTFELESLIFYALTYAIGSKTIGVYGDDIICDASVSESLIQLLDYVGFSINLKKSFVKGAFYESCGKHYHRGGDVSPCYIRGNLADRDLFGVLTDINGILRWSMRTYGEYRYKLVTPLIKLLPSSIRNLRIPDGFGDGAVIGDNIPLVYGKYRCTVIVPERTVYAVDELTPYFGVGLLIHKHFCKSSDDSHFGEATMNRDGGGR